MGTGKPGGRCRGSELATGRKGKWWGRYKGLSEQGGSCKGSGRATGGLTREVLRGRGRSPNIFGAPESLQNDPGSPKLGGGVIRSKPNLICFRLAQIRTKPNFFSLHDPKMDLLRVA